MWIEDKDYQSAVQKAFEEGLEQGYWVGRMISGALGRKDGAKQSDNCPQDTSTLLQQIMEISKEKEDDFTDFVLVEYQNSQEKELQMLLAQLKETTTKLQIGIEENSQNSSSKKSSNYTALKIVYCMYVEVCRAATVAGAVASGVNLVTSPMTPLFFSLAKKLLEYLA